MFLDNATTELWVFKRRWPTGACYPRSGSLRINTNAKRKSMRLRCHEKVCAANFSVKTGTFMQSSKLGYWDWLFAIYFASTSLKGISSIELHRDVGTMHGSRLRFLDLMADNGPLSGARS